jgi:hypothetical protein
MGKDLLYRLAERGRAFCAVRPCDKSVKMKPNFALSLSFEGIRLLHRAAGGWRVVGDVALDAEDLPGELAVLRKTAAALEPGGVRSKVIIPNAQIKYLTFDSDGLSGTALDEAARAALEGATPYAVADLVFDVSPDGPQSHIAAVARETLDEAEAFAEEHRFHPVSFAAIPGDHAYLGEPFFGQTGAAAALLEPGEKVDPDGIAVVVIGEASAPQGPVVADANEGVTQEGPHTAAPDTDDPADEVPTDDASVDDIAVHDIAVDDVAADDVVVAKVVAEDVVAEKTAGEDTAPPAPTKTIPASESAAPQPVRTETTPEARPERNDPSPEKTDASQEAVKSAEPDETDKVGSAVAAAAATKPVTAPPAGKIAPPGAETTQPAPEKVEDPQVDARPPRPVQPVVQPSAKPFPELRVDMTEPANAKVAPLPDLVPSETGSGTATPAPLAGFASRRALANEGGSARLGGASRGADTAASTSVAAPGIAAATTAPPGPDSSSLTQTAPTAARTGFLSRRKPADAKTGRTPKGSAATLPSAPAFATAGAASEAERMTIFGARKSGQIGGKPRFLGLLLTAALLVFLAGVAAWASVFLDDGIKLSRLFGDREPRMTASDALDVIAAVPQDAPPVGLPGPLAEAPVAPEADATLTAALDPALTDTDGAVLSALRDPVVPLDAPLTDQQVASTYAVTGIWPRAPDVPEPPAVITLEDLYVTSIDPVSTSTDAVALPQADSFASDLTLAGLASPAAADTNFTLDSRGLVVPTPQGAITPDGILVFLGRPPVVPPDALTRSLAEPDVDPARAELVGLRPRPRPGDLVETTERAQLDGLTRIELAGFRPALRPASVQQRAEAAAAATAPPTPIETDAAVTAALAVPVPAPAIENATAYAVQVSLRPDTRPRNFDRIVKRAQRTAPEPQQVASAAATVAPRSVQPSIPSTASVARQATVKNAINLRNVNLIGVYGKPSNRRALVRLSNGRYQKVVVGDRMDGGRVSAIGDSELRYTKRGRDVVLRMPRN